MRRGHDRLGVGRAAELEVEQRHAADGALLDHPGDVAVPALLEQDARHVGRDAEAEIDRASRRCSSCATRRAITLSMPHSGVCGSSTPAGTPRRRSPGRRRSASSASGRARPRSCRPARRARARRCGFSVPAFGDALHLRDHDAAIVADRQRLVERAEIGALVLVGEVAALVGRGGADDRDVAARWSGRTARCRRRTRPCGRSARRAAAFMAQPWRSGSTKVSRPTLVSTPGRLAAASRCMSNRMPDGML